MEYLDFDIDVTPGEAGAYDVHARSEFGEADASMRLPFDTLALANRLQALQIALLRSGSVSRRVATPEEQTVQVFGQELFEALFSGSILGRFEAARDGAWQREVGIRIKLRIASPELAALPWEYLYDPGRGDFLGLSVNTPMVRYIPLPRPVRPLAIKPPIRILGMIAASPDLPEIDSGRETQRLETALAPLVARGLVELEWLPSGTWRDLQRWLLSGPWHIFHFIGHGGFDEIRAEGYLWLPDENGRATRLPATGLGRLLGDHDPMRLAVLNACEGARADNLDVFSSTAAGIVQRGTPAVVAMQYEITDLAAIEFSRSFYSAIAEGRPVDASLAVARKSISLDLPGTLEWGTPALYMRSPDGILFDVDMLSRPAPAVASPPVEMFVATAVESAPPSDDVPAPVEVAAALPVREASPAAEMAASAAVEAPPPVEAEPPSIDVARPPELARPTELARPVEVTPPSPAWAPTPIAPAAAARADPVTIEQPIAAFVAATPPPAPVMSAADAFDRDEGASSSDVAVTSGPVPTDLGSINAALLAAGYYVVAAGSALATLAVSVLALNFPYPESWDPETTAWQILAVLIVASAVGVYAAMRLAGLFGAGRSAIAGAVVAPFLYTIGTLFNPNHAIREGGVSWWSFTYSVLLLIASAVVGHVFVRWNGAGQAGSRPSV